MPNPKHWVLYGPPGTGKTRSLIEAVGKHLSGHPGRYALLCSHTRAAATTAVERWGKQTGRMDIQTLHSFCFKSLKLSRAQTIDDEKLKVFCETFGLDYEDEGSEGRQYVELISLAGSRGVSAEQAYEESSRPGTYSHFQSFWATYQKWKSSFGYVDFNDMLLRYAEARAPRPTGHTLLAIDEAQDLTPLHWRVINMFMIANPECRVYVAGDDDQCIYSYAGADPHGAATFAERFQAGTRVLEQSYRVPRSVFELSQDIIRRVSQRVDKKYSPRAEDGYVNHVPRGFEEFGADIKDTSDILVLYSDRFIRKDVVEPVLHDHAIPYIAVSGFPGPFQSKAGQALRLAHRQAVFDEAEKRTIRRGLSEKGIAAFDTVGAETVAKKLREGDHSLLNVHWSLEDYFVRTDWRAEPRVRISTIHGAKGMEATEVHLITGQSPAAHSAGLAEPDAAHRLFYVGVTRAAQGLAVYPGDNGYELPRDA